MSEIFPQEGPEVWDLMERLLDLNPKTRMSVDEGLAHPYLAKISKEMPEQTDSSTIAPTLNFNFEKKKLNLRQLRRVIEKEVSSLKAENLEAKRSSKTSKTSKTAAAKVVDQTQSQTNRRSRPSSAHPSHRQKSTGAIAAANEASVNQ